MSIILASASPRRKELLSMVTGDFEVIVPKVGESLPEGTPPDEAVETLAQRKARAVAKAHPGRIVIGSDTVVAVDGEILGKPKDDADAERMLRLLSGRWHQVHTGVCVISGGQEHSCSETTWVLFGEMTEQEIAEYIASGEHRDKAGAYAIQGLAARHITSIDGDFYTVVGLPVHWVYFILKRLGAI